MMIAEEAGIFRDKEPNAEMLLARLATRDNAYQYAEWEKIVNGISKKGKGHNVPDHSAELRPFVRNMVISYPFYSHSYFYTLFW